MPAIADPYAARPYDAPPDTFHQPVPDGRSRSLRVRIRTALHRAELTRALAEGADLRTRDELALRAAQLTSDRSRRTLARTLRRTITEAHQPAMTRSRVVIISRTVVLDAQDAITATIERLGGSNPVRAEGTAIAERLLTNADRSPLYNSSEPGTLRREIGVATEALDPAPAQSRAFPIAA